MNKNSRIISFSIKLTKEIDSEIKLKALDYGICKQTMGALLEYVGLFVLLKMEKSLEDITFRKGKLKEVIRKLATGEDINGLKWGWGIKEFMQQAIKCMSAEETLVFGLKNIKTNVELDKEILEELSKEKLE